MISLRDIGGAVILSALAAGCASSAQPPRILLLESDTYGCGAAPGLGCGLALAPVLEAIEQVEGVDTSRVSWDGRYFRIDLLPGVDRDRVAREVETLLDGEERQLAASDSSVDLSRDWFDSHETISLSRYEAGVIAADVMAELMEQVGLDSDEQGRLQTLLRDEVERAFERAHAAGGGVSRLWEQLPQARADFEGQLDFLSDEQRAQVATYLAHAFDE